MSGSANVPCDTFSIGDTCIHRLDPRVRIIASLAFSGVIAVSEGMATIGAGLGIAVALAVLARLPVGPALKRMTAVNTFMALVILMLPLTMPGSVLFEVGPLQYSREGLMRAAAIALKGNAIVLCLTALLATVEIARLGHALGRLHAPHKLTHLLHLTVRYIDVLQHEYVRLATAMKVRGFRAGMNSHTCRSLGYLVGMLLVKSFDRSECLMAAMKCRGFRGRFHVLDDLTLAGRDVAFSVAAAAVLAALTWAEWA